MAQLQQGLTTGEMGFGRPFAQQQSWAAHVRFGLKADIEEGATDVRFTPKSGHWDSAAKCPLCAKRDIMQRSNRIAPIGACTAEFLPVVGVGCKAPAHSHHILLLALSVLPHPARGK